LPVISTPRALADTTRFWVIETRDLITWRFTFLSLNLHEHAKVYVSSSIASRPTSGFGLWAVWTRSPRFTENSELIGFCGFVNASFSNIHPPEGLEVAWGLRPDFHGQGLALEAAKPVVSYGFHEVQVPKLIAITNPKNTASRSLMERLGFSFTEMVTAYGEIDVLYTLSRQVFFNLFLQMGEGDQLFAGRRFKELRPGGKIY
jgi:RimJ/RimL family protein N-acetyltransferase